MGLLRASAAPLTGAALAGLLLYTCRESLSQRTHELTSSLHLSSRSLRRLAEVDDDGLRKSPFGKDVQRNLQESEEEILERIRSAYHAPAKPSLVEEVKSRWNEHLLALTRSMSETDLDTVIEGTSSTFRSLYARLTGAPLPVPSTGSASSLRDRLTGVTHKAVAAVSSSDAPATLRDPIAPHYDSRLDASNTHYLGQGASLR